MEKLDREYQLQILQAASAVYPQQLYVHGELAGRGGQDIELNCAYLEEHSLVKLRWVGSVDSGRVVLSVAATALGMDYLASDGGISAILAVRTVRLETDTVRQIFIERVKDVHGDRITKDKLIARISSLPADELKTMTQTALSAGLKSLPNPLAVLDAWAQEF